MKKNIIITIFLCLIVITVSLLNYKNKNNRYQRLKDNFNIPFVENFGVVENIDFYVITMRGEERMNNIQTQKEKLNKHNFDTKNFYLIDAIVGKTIDIDQMIKDNVLDPEATLNVDPDLEKRKQIRQREVACYLSHMKAIETIRKKNKEGYSVIFEDDFNLFDDFLEVLDKTIQTAQTIDFDFIFLGIIGYLGDNVIDNIYNLHVLDSWGAHGYMVNNKSADKILDKMKRIETVLDKEIFDKGKAKELIVYRIDPLIVDTVSMHSGIR